MNNSTNRGAITSDRDTYKCLSLSSLINLKSYITLIIITLLFYHNVQAQWEYMNEGLKGWINSIDFVNEEIGWFAGSGGMLCKTENGGENWKFITINENWDIGEIDFFNENIGWAIGKIGRDSDYGFIAKSSDGGNSWEIQAQFSAVDFFKICIVDQYHVNIIERNRKVWFTTNGGDSWTQRNINNWCRLKSLDFINPNVGIVTGSYNTDPEQAVIAKTINGGINWTIKFVPQYNSIHNLVFLDDSTAYFIAEDEDSNYFCETNDTGNTWTVKWQTPHRIISYSTINKDTIYAHTSEESSIMKSTDGGINWEVIQSFEFLSLSKILYTKSGRGFLMASTHYCWNPALVVCNENDLEIKIFSYPIYDVTFIDENRGVLIGGCEWGVWVHDCTGTGNIISTYDGGLTWDINKEINNVGRTIQFVNDQTGYLLTSSCLSNDFNSQVYKSENSGITWEMIYKNNLDSTGFNFYGNDVCFMNSKVGWAVGKSHVVDSILGSTYGAGILKTNDGGESWDLEKQFPDSNWSLSSLGLKSVYSTTTYCWAVGEEGMIVKYSAQDGWVLRPVVTDLPLNEVFFFDESYGWIAGGYLNDDNFQHIVMRTTDGGETWIADQTTPYLVNDIHFIDSLLGWAVGTDESWKGVILKTTTGGEEWEVEVGNLIGPLNSIAVKENLAWAVGEYGLVLRTTNNGLLWVDDNANEIYVTEFRLEQNYPNPFNPSTTIKYQIPKGSFVSIKIYDVLGNELETLVNKEQSQGIYEIEFDGSKLSSGIFFYKLKTDAYSESRKMILLK